MPISMVPSVANCAAPRCISRYIEEIYIGPEGQLLCKMDAFTAWESWKEKEAARLGVVTVASKSKPDFIAKRRCGVMIIYPGSYTKAVKSLWTPTRCYPYPNWRKKYGLKKSYQTDACKEVKS